MSIIALAGHARVGKSTVAEIIQRLEPEKNWEIKGFSQALKQVAEILTGIPAHTMDRQDVKEMELGKEWDTWQYKGRNIGSYVEPHFVGDASRKRMTVRELLQKLGTEAVRNNLHEDAWVNALFSQYIAKTIATGTNEFDIMDTDVQPNWIITDVRFPNELKAIKDHGGTDVRVTRPYYKPVNAHPSETALDDQLFSYYINNNGDLNYLEQQVKKFLHDRRVKESIHLVG